MANNVMVIKRHLFDFIIDLVMYFSFLFRLCKINIYHYVSISKLFKVDMSLSL